MKINVLNSQRSDLFGSAKFFRRFNGSVKIARNPNCKVKLKIVVDGQEGDLGTEEISLKDPITLNNSINELLRDDVDASGHTDHFSEDEKFRIVLEGRNGPYSIDEICSRENISRNEFLDWSDEFVNVQYNRLPQELETDKFTFRNKKNIINIVGSDGLDYFENFIDTDDSATHVTSFSLLPGKKIKLNNFVCLSKINDVRHINKYFEEINRVLPHNGIYIGCLESFKARKQRKTVSRISFFNNLYFGFEFLFKRILPKLQLTKKHYFNLTSGKDRLLSKAEGLGRLVSCGFSIVDYKSMNGLIYFVVKKTGFPTFDMNPSYGPIYAMPRIGKNGKEIRVYKLRTMHPYSEYLQDYVLKVNGYATSGKPADDFRIPSWGRYFRRYWLDELPQLINVLKGEMKLVGIRPVSERYFRDIPKEMQKLRLTQKPGCIPPYVSLNRGSSVLSVLQAEKDYLEEKVRNPYSTDLKYLCKAIFNIVVNRKRSA